MSKTNNDMNDQEKLYEFKDIETEQQQARPNFIRKLLSLNSKFASFSSNDDLNINNIETIDKVEVVNQVFNDKNQHDSDSLSSNKSNIKEDSPRPILSSSKYTLSNVLKQVYDAQNNTSGNGGPSKEFWMPDDQVKECFNCNDKFTVYKRRHHCRVCGQIFCSKCSDYEIQAHLIWPNQTTGKIRVCTFCYALVSQLESGNEISSKTSINEFMQRVALSPGLTIQIPSSISVSNEEKVSPKIVSSVSSTNKSNSYSSNVNSHSNPFDIAEYRDYLKQQENEIAKLITNNASELRNLWIQLYHTSEGIPFTSKSINKFKKISNCISSIELIEWLMRKKSVTKDQAIVIGQALVHGKWLESATSSGSNVEHIFSEVLAYYRPGSAAVHTKSNDTKTKSGTNRTEEPEWFNDLNQIITQFDGAQEDTLSNNLSLSPTKPDDDTKLFKREIDEDSSLNQINAELKAFRVEDSSLSVNYEEEMLKFNPFEDYHDLHKQHQLRILEQLLKTYDLSFDWFDIILKLVWKAVDLVKPDVKHDNDHMDIRTYIKIKKIPNENVTKQESRIVNGIVFTKNVAHKQMQAKFKNPKVLLLRSSIEYQRVEEKLCSLEPLLTAETQYLKNNCSKLLKMSPDILVVEKSVARLAQEFLLQSGIILILNVKTKVMDKLCRFLQADPMTSIDDVKKLRLGYCVDFHVDMIGVKPFMFFEGTPTNLGCTILLTGANEQELVAIKNICYFMIYTAYNSKLEQSFLIDKSAFYQRIEKTKHKDDDLDTFKGALNRILLTNSPFVRFDLPFLVDTSLTSKSLLLSYLPNSFSNYFKSKLINANQLDFVKNTNKKLDSTDYSYNPIGNWPRDFQKIYNTQHEYQKIHLTNSIDDINAKRLYADYRSRGQKILVHEKNDTKLSSQKAHSSKTRQIDCLDIMNRQNLCVLFYSQCENSPVYPNLCIKPRIINLKFYNDNDMTLGSFLTRNCFRNFYMCTNELCNTLILQHTRYFVHGDSQISIKMNVLNDDTPSTHQTSILVTSSGDDPTETQKFDEINIFMWNVCRVCKKSTRKCIMSPHTWSYSFGKFLELTFYAHEYLSLQVPSKSSSRQDDLICVHSLFHDYDQYFRFKNMQTVFSYSKIVLNYVNLPLTELKAQNSQKYRTNCIDEIKDLSEKGLTLFSTLIDRLNALKGPSLNEKQNQKLDLYVQQLSAETNLKLKIEKINLLLSNFNRTDNEKQTSCIDYDKIDLLMTDLKKYIAYSVQNWNMKMSDFYKKSKHDEVETQETDEAVTEHELNQKALSSELTSDEKSTSLKRLFSNLLPTQTFTPLKIPFPDEEHYILTGESDYYVNDKDLISIISYTLSCREYKDYLTNKTKTFVPADATNKETLFAHLNEGDDPHTIKNLESDAHFDFQFHNTNTKFYCKIYHAELFHQLRQLLFANDKESYVHSLFRCMNWEAKGGKSNSQFRKTLDNRFVIKEMSSREVQSFIDFIPKYIKYITDCLKNKKATALTKIVGAYRIYMLKNTSLTSNRAVKIDVIVLENLFYRRKCTQVFDLKGSERNRLVNTQGKTSEKELVLLDENFLRWSFDNPTYIRCYEKYVLMKAVESDSEFLSSEFVMDYSLLCGYDSVNNEIVVGIIDYIRTFTWDKKLETYFKMIGGKRMPTIVSPEVYRSRFVNAIDRYFLEVPDHWYQDPKEFL